MSDKDDTTDTKDHTEELHSCAACRPALVQRLADGVYWAWAMLDMEWGELVSDWSGEAPPPTLHPKIIAMLGFAAQRRIMGAA